MRKIIYVLVILTTGLLSLSMFSQIENEPVAIGLPGDNLNLYAVLDVFQKSPTLESFERAINDRDSHINNLDLNNDNAIDYIAVVSNRIGNSFSVVLRVAVNSNEYQDVAVIEGFKNNTGKVIRELKGTWSFVGLAFSEDSNTLFYGTHEAYYDIDKGQLSSVNIKTGKINKIGKR
mgnify:CR=1 FL=1